MHLAPIILNAQVGIGTTDPQATLHIVSKSDTLLLIDKKDSEGNITPAVTVDNNGNMFTKVLLPFRKIIPCLWKMVMQTMFW